MATVQIQTLPYERIDDDALLKAIRLFDGEHLLVLQPFGWHLDAKHIPNAAEHFSREGVCQEHGWVVVCDYGEHVAIVKERETTQSWSVTVERNGEDVVTLSNTMQAGRDISDEDARVIRMAAEHLRSFVGEPASVGAVARPDGDSKG
jgi:hypothetical protein